MPREFIAHRFRLSEIIKQVFQVEWIYMSEIYSKRLRA